MRILIVRNSPTEIKLNNYNVQEIGLAKSLIKKGHDVGIVFFTNSTFVTSEMDGIRLYSVPGKKILNYVLYNDIIYDIASSYDIIQSSEYNQIMSYKLMKKYGNKVIIYHGPYYRKNIKTIINNNLFDIIYLRKIRHLNPMIITKSYLAEDFLRKKGFKKIKTLGVGLDDSKFECDNDELFNNVLDKNRYNIVTISTIEKRKNTYFLLKLLNRLVKIDDKYFMTFIGRTKEEKYMNKCLRFIKDNNLEFNVKFIDSISQDKLPGIYKSTNLFLLASSYEIFGMVLLEAMYFNVPIISSLNGGSSYLLDEKQIVKNFNIENWVNAILNSNDNVCYNKPIIWDDLVNKFIKIYEEVCSNEK